MMLSRLRKILRTASKPAQRYGNPLKLEWLEDRVVPSIPDGTLLVATLPGSNATTTFSGILGFDPNTGNQVYSLSGPFVEPIYMTEDPTTGMLYVADVGARYPSGVIWAVNPNTNQVAALPISNLGGPGLLTYLDGNLIILNLGTGTFGSGVHYITQFNLATGTTTTYTDNFLVPTGIVAVPGQDAVYVCDEQGNYSTNEAQFGAGAIYKVTFTGAAPITTPISRNGSQGNDFDHPVDMAIDAGGDLLVANTGNNNDHVTGSLFLVNPSNGQQTWIVQGPNQDGSPGGGTGFGSFSGTDSVEFGSNGDPFVGEIQGGSPAQILEVSGEGPGASYFPLTTGATATSLSSVEGMRTYYAPTVQAAATSTTVTSSLNPSAFGQGVTFTATVTPTGGSGIPTGTVSFFDGATLLNTAALNSAGTASFTISTLSVGSHTITASYGGDNNFLPSESDPLNQVVNQAGTNTTLTSSSFPSSVSGQQVTFTATISVQSPGTTAAAFPTNTVTLFDATTNTTLDTEPVSTNGGITTATFNISNLSAGTHKLTATYNGDTNFATSTSSTWTQTVTNPLIGTNTTLSSSTNNASVFGQSVTFTATVSPQTGNGTLTGSVQFVIDNGSPVTISLGGGGIATYTTATLTVGTHTITASYTGDNTFAGSSSAALTQTVSQADTNTTLTSSPSQPVYGQAVTFTATVSAVSPGAGTPTGSVLFVIDNGTPVKASLGNNGIATYTTSALTAGTHTVTTSYSGDGSFLAGSSTALSQTVNQANTSTRLTSSANPVVAGQTVTFTALVGAQAPGAGTPTGSVQFTVDNGTPATESLNDNGVATYSTSSLAMGTHTVTASYAGDVNFLSGSSAALTQTVIKQAPTTTTSLSASVNPSVFGQSVTFTAMVSPQSGGGTLTGAVQFVIDNGSPVTVNLNGSGTALYSTAALGVGTHTITASYRGDGNFLPSTSSPVTQMVNQAGTSVTVSSSLNPSPAGKPVTFTATVSVQRPGAGTPTGTVQFQINGFDTGSPVNLSSSGTASFTSSSFTLGNQTVTAIYGGDSNFSGSSGMLPGGQQIFFSLGLPTNTTVSSNANPSIFSQNVTFTATVSGGFSGILSPTGTVQFMIDGRDAGSPVSVTTSNGLSTASYRTASLAVGTHTVQAVYSGNSNFSSSSGILAGGQTVSPGASTATTTAISSALSPSVFGQSVLFTATITANGGNGTPSGTVQFAIDGNPSGSPVNVSGSGGVATASFSTASLTAGTHTITASYSGDATFLPSSGNFTQSVNPANTTTVVSSSVNPSTVGQTVTFTATISVQSPGGGAPTGTVQFEINGSPLGSPVNVSNSGGVVTASTTDTFSAANTYTITANYSGDANFAASSGSFTQTVQSAPTSTANVTVTLDPTTGILSITGDSGNDAITVRQNSPGVLQISGNNTLINRSSSPATYALSSINEIDVAMLNGNDTMSMSDFSLPGTLSIVAGSGTDTITLDTITANLLSLSTAGPAADLLTLNNLTNGSATVTAGANATLTLTGMNSTGTVALTAGSNASISVNNLTATGDLDITAGNNAQMVTVKGSSANNLDIVQTGFSGNPLFDLENDAVYNLRLQASGGNNRLVFSHLKVAVELLVLLGANNNALTADHVSALFGIIDAPGGNNIYNNGGNNSGLFVFGF
jgi:hypothetical protein